MRSLGRRHRPNPRSSCRASWPRSHARNEATVIDLSLSPNYRKGHIPGAWFAIRSRLAQALPKIPLRGELVLTSEDGVLAGLAVAEARALTGLPVRYLAGRQRGVAGCQASALHASRTWPTIPSTSGSSPTSAPATPPAR